VPRGYFICHPVESLCHAVEFAAAVEHDAVAVVAASECPRTIDQLVDRLVEAAQDPPERDACGECAERRDRDGQEPNEPQAFLVL
jgi:hypothetical protein